MPPPYTFLVVDDDDDDKELFIEVVSEIDQSIEVLSASNGREALQLLEKTERLPHIIFLDLNMPRMNGRQCLDKLKQDLRLASIPVIIYSTSNIPEDKDEALKSGAYSFITKPSCMKQLKVEIDNIIKALLKV